MVLRGGDGPPAEGVKECQVVHSVYNRGVPTRVDAVLSHGHVLDGSRLVCCGWGGLDTGQQRLSIFLLHAAPCK